MRKGRGEKEGSGKVDTMCLMQPKLGTRSGKTSLNFISNTQSTCFVNIPKRGKSNTEVTQNKFTCILFEGSQEEAGPVQLYLRMAH